MGNLPSGFKTREQYNKYMREYRKRGPTLPSVEGFAEQLFKEVEKQVVEELPRYYAEVDQKAHELPGWQSLTAEQQSSVRIKMREEFTNQAVEVLRRKRQETEQKIEQLFRDVESRLTREIQALDAKRLFEKRGFIEHDASRSLEIEKK